MNSCGKKMATGRDCRFAKPRARPVAIFFPNGIMMSYWFHFRFYCYVTRNQEGLFYAILPSTWIFYLKHVCIWKKNGGGGLGKTKTFWSTAARAAKYIITGVLQHVAGEPAVLAFKVHREPFFFYMIALFISKINDGTVWFRWRPLPCCSCRRLV